MGHNHQHALAVLQGQIDGVLQPLFVAAVDQKLVDDQLDEVGLVAVELHAVSDVADFAVDPHLNESALAYLLEEFLVVTLAPLDQRRQDVDALAGVFFLNQLLDLLIGIAHHLFAGDIRVGFGRARIEQAQEVVDFGDCADGRARVLVRRLLLDGDDRREARNLVDVRAFGAAEKLPCVGRKGLDVAALAFGIDGVESQRRLAAAAHAGDDHQPVARNGDVDVFQIVLAGAIDADVFFLGINGFGRIVGCLSHCGCRLLFVGCKDSAKRAQNGQNLF